jgi:hypothetical protein
MSMTFFQGNKINLVVLLLFSHEYAVLLLTYWCHNISPYHVSEIESPTLLLHIMRFVPSVSGFELQFHAEQLNCLVMCNLGRWQGIFDNFHVK